jgi:hypothetical protein
MLLPGRHIIKLAINNKSGALRLRFYYYEGLEPGAARTNGACAGRKITMNARIIAKTKSLGMVCFMTFSSI